jgi:pyridinium-3,5-biscarboxylic acid mononucleotide sulfurtransferase
VDDSRIDERLQAALQRHDALAIAVSGGVDSMTLATFAHRRRPGSITVVHAVSPAVPAAATALVRSLAATEGWSLTVTAAGEFDDPRYRSNPVDRCYFCKSNLYGRIRALTPHAIASGANLDDLGDYRPGLLAAAEREVVHPYIEARMEKAAVRLLARRLDLGEIAELPAQPCLASRIETGISVEAEDLAFVDRMERRLGKEVRADATIRCRVTRQGIIVECAEVAAEAVPSLQQIAAALCAEAGRRFGGIRDYRRGSMFVRSDA